MGGKSQKLYGARFGLSDEQKQDLDFLDLKKIKKMGGGIFFIFLYFLCQTSLHNRFFVTAHGGAAQHILEECMSSPRFTARPVTARGQYTAEDAARTSDGSTLQKMLRGPQTVAHCRRCCEDLRRQYTAEEAVMKH